MERAEKIGLGIATAGHVLLFGVLSVGFLSTPNPLKLRTPPIEVTLVDKVGMEMAAPQISEEEMRASEAPELGPTEEAAPEPKPVAEPEPVPAPPKKAEPAPAPKPAEKVKPKPAPPKKSEARPEAPKAKPKPEKQARGSRLGDDFLKGIQTERSTGTAVTPPAQKMSSAQVASLNAVISSQIYPHLRLPSGADVEKLVALLDVKLDRNGAVVGTPEVIDIQGETENNRPQVALYKERAVQAVLQASPFRNLPVEYYNEWRWLSPLRVYARKAQ
ncbi:MAG TPA: cell envelope biogenesis protein TolA [Rhizorhapis sp.]|nr:cell envelope biogenesis protein TolA [Rhizorhapis sp.]